MSGIAIIIQNADFSAKNLGTVSFLEDVSITGITISCENSYSETSFKPTITYTPVNTSQVGVTWSLTSGSQYASINSNTGEVTINSGVTNQSITIQAVSIYDNTITTTKQVTVTYHENVDILNSISINGASSVEGKTSNYTVTYNPVNTVLTGVTWSITSGITYASIDASTGVLTIASVANGNDITIRATSIHDSSIYDDMVVNVTYQAYTPIFGIFDESASDDFGGSTGCLINIPISGNHTIKYIKIKIASDSPAGGKAIKIGKTSTYPTLEREVASITYLGAIFISSNDVGKTVIKEISPTWNISDGEYLAVYSQDGCKWLGDSSDTSKHYAIYYPHTGRYGSVNETGNFNVEFME
jgi:hypothetical protein